MNNNPFQPTNQLPPVMNQGDVNADNFTAQAQPVTFENFAQAQAAAAPAPEPVPTLPEIPAEPAPIVADVPDMLDPVVAQSEPVPTPVPDKFESLMNQVDNTPANLKPPKTHHFSISILTLLFFVLTIAGAAGTFYFQSENSKNSNELKDALAKITELETNGRDNSIITDTSGGQFDALQEKIATLNKKDDENTKTIEDQKKQIEELTKKNETLTTEKSDLQKKADDITKLVDKLDNVLKNCKIIGGGTPQTCSLAIP